MVWGRKNRDPKLDRLAAVELFAHCSPKELESIASITDQVDLPAGRTLCSEGEIGREAFVLIAGTVDVTVKGERVGSAGPGETVGEMALVNNTPRVATAVAATPVSAYVIVVNRFASLIEEIPVVGEAVRRAAEERARANAEGSR